MQCVRIRHMEKENIWGEPISKVIEISGKNTAKEVVEEINNSMGDKNWSRPLLFIKIHKDKEKIYVYLVQG